MPEKRIIKLCSASRMTFGAWFYRTDPQNIGGQFGTLFESERTKKAPKYISDRKVSGLFFRNEHQFIPWQLRFWA